METDFDEVRPLVGSVDATTSKSKFKVAPGTEEIRFYSVETLTRNFYGLALAFSVSNACATSCLDYATALLGNRLGGFSSGALFATYAATSFFLSKSIVTTIGPKNGLTCGVIGYSAYVCGFLISAMLVNLLPSLASFILLLTSIIGGIAGGVLWTSQGLYFTRHAALYAQSTAQEIDRITGDFSAIFAVILLGMEMAVKLVGSIMFTLLGSYGIVALAFLYITGVLFSCFVIMRIKTLDMRGTWDTSYQTVSKDTGAVARLVYTDSRLGLLLPFQMAFGLASSFVPYYIFGTIVSGSPSMGISAVGLLSAMVVLTGALSAIPISFFANAFGKPKAIILGAICLILTGLPMWIFCPMTLGSWAIIVPLLVIYGVGRAVWETINKAVFVDFFAEDYDKNASAFSAATFANGYASGMAYITYSYMSSAQMTSVLVFACAVGLFAYLQAFSAQDKHKQRMRAEAEAETHLDAIRMEGRKSRRDRDRKMTLDRLAAQSLNLSPEKSPGRGRGGSGSEDGGGSRNSGRVSPSLSFSMGSGGISLITGSRGGSHEDLIDAFKSVATRKIGGGVGGALGNFSASVGVRPRESKSKSSKSKSKSKSKSMGGGKSSLNGDGGAAGGAGNPADAGSADGGDDGMISAIDEGEDEETGLSRSGDSQDSSLSGDRRGTSSGAL